MQGFRAVLVTDHLLLAKDGSLHLQKVKLSNLSGTLGVIQSFFDYEPPMNQSNFRVALDFLKQISDDQKVFRNLTLAGTTLEKFQSPKGCSFIEIDFQNCRMPWSVLISCRIKNSLFNHANLMGSIIAGSDCEGTSFADSNLSRVNFFKSRLTRAIFRNAELTGVNFKDANLRGADFRGTTVEKAVFTGAIFDSTTLFDPNIDPEKLGLRLVEDNQDDESNIQVDPGQKPSMRYRGALVEKKATVADKSKKKGIKYRGVEVSDEPEVIQVPASKKEVKRFYRGVRIS